MVDAIPSRSVQHNIMQKDTVDMLRGDIPPPSRAAGVMYNLGWYVSVIEPELHTRFLENLMKVCKDFEDQSDAVRERVSCYTTCFCKCLHLFILLLLICT